MPPTKALPRRILNKNPSGAYYPMKFHYVEREVSEGQSVRIAVNNRTLTLFAMLGISPIDPICKAED